MHNRDWHSIYIANFNSFSIDRRSNLATDGCNENPTPIEPVDLRLKRIPQGSRLI